MTQFRLVRPIRMTGLSASFALSGNVVVDGPVVANAFTLSGSTTGTNGVASTFTVTPNGTMGTTVVVTPAATNSGSVSPSSLTFTAGTSAAQTFTVTRASSGVSAVTIANNSGLSTFYQGGGSSISYTSTSSSDWLTRSTGAGVVWSHNFDRSEEVTAHLTNANVLRTVIPPRRAVDAKSGIPCLEQVIVGGTLAAPFTVGSTTMTLVDDTLWPDPSITGSFYVMVSEINTPVPDKNIFLVTARSGKTLTVSYYSLTIAGFTAPAKSYPAGALIGNEEMRQWIRVFSALPANENGLLANDLADGGLVPIRSKSATGTYGVPRDLDLWGYGNYGHVSNQTTWQNWTPWVGATNYTQRGPINGAAAKYGLWDGAEFYMQFRVKIDSRYWMTHVYPAYTSGRKGWAIINEVSTYNELVTGISPGSGPFAIPSTRESMFSIGTNKASAIIGRSDTTRVNPSDQYGSPWHVAPYYANGAYGGGPLPSTGASTPDGSAAWEYKADEWITFYIRVKPGRSAIAESEIEIKFARTEDPNYDGTYTTVLNVTDAKLTYSGSGDYLYPDGSFSYPTVATMNALPGFQAFWLFGYLNIWQSWNIPPPPASYSYKIGQVIFSRQPIAAPASEVPTWRVGQSVNEWRELTNSAHSLNPPTGPATLTVAGTSSVSGPEAMYTAWCGLTVDRRNSKAWMLANGGHGDYFGNSVHSFNLLANSPAWTQVVQRSAGTVVNTNAIGRALCFYTDGKPSSSHTYYSTQFIELTGKAVRIGVHAPSNAPSSYFVCDSFNVDSATPAWDADLTVPDIVPGGGAQVIPGNATCKNPITGEIYYFYYNQWVRKLANNVWSGNLQTGSPPINFDDCASAYDTTRNRIFLLRPGTTIRYTFNTTTGTFTQQTLTGTGLTGLNALVDYNKGCGLVYVASIDSYLLMGGAAGGVIYKINASTFDVTLLATTGGGSIPAAPRAISGNYAHVYNRFEYVPQLGGVVYFPTYTSNAWFLRIH